MTIDPTISDAYADNTLVSIESPTTSVTFFAVFNRRFGISSSGFSSKLVFYFFPISRVS